MADKNDDDFVVNQLIEDFQLEDGQPVDGKTIAEMISKSVNLFQEKSAHDNKES